MKIKLENLFFRRFHYIEIVNEQSYEESESKGSIQIKHIKSGFSKKDGSFNGVFSLTIASGLFVLETEVHGKVAFESKVLFEEGNEEIILREIGTTSLELISKETNKRLNEYLKWSPTQLEEFVEFWVVS